MKALKKPRLADAWRVAIPRKADKVPVPEVAKKHGISEQTIHNQRSIWAALIAHLLTVPEECIDSALITDAGPFCQPDNDFICLIIFSAR